MKGTRKSSVIAIALALVLALSVLMGAGTVPVVTGNEGDSSGGNGITFSVTCECCGKAIQGAEVTVTAKYTVASARLIQEKSDRTAAGAEAERHGEFYGCK